MQKIKFKIAYKPLSTEQVNKHKDFDALMGMYAAAPQLNFFQKLFKNKWIMFSSGIIIGGLIATVIALNSTDKSPDTIAQNNSSDNTQTITQTPTTVIEENQIDEQTTVITEEPVINNASPVIEHSAEVETLAATTQSEQYEKVANSTTVANDIVANKKIDETTNKNDLGLTPISNDVVLSNTEKPDVQNPEVDLNKNNITPNTTSISQRTLQQTEKITPFELQAYKFNVEQKAIEISIVKPGAVAELLLTQQQSATNNTTKNQTITQSPTNNSKTLAQTPDTSVLVAKVSEVAALALKIEKKADALFEQITKSNQTKNDTTTIVSNNVIPDSVGDNNEAKTIAPATFKNRYAQLSFVTPVSSNGIDGYKYYHHFSVNMIQGYNGAVQGLEVGGVLNADKGYVIGGQFAGVGNVIGGDLTGMQGAGVFNFAKSTFGMQYSGVANYSKSGMRGMQGAGIANYSGGQVDGMQAAGIINIASGTNYSGKLMQAAGVINIATSNDLLGLQASGIVNVANNITGAQIGLINLAKNVKGTQIGLINIADTIDGVAIGLLSFSRNGIFDVEVYNSDLFLANIALRFGSPYVYNTFAFGINPAADTMQYGYGFGIGGHIPVVNKFAVDVDGMIWNTFEDNFDFNYDYVHLLNQFRVMPSYAITKYLSVYGGPVINVEVFDNDYTPFKENTFASYEGLNVTTGLSLGYVVGIRLF
ncbi:MAG TPA: hypothetical protein PLB46_14610 [Chitinophagales bacterium]|nr:hypothetical protein [Chitinophagales bacterium]HRG85944.1 hypothetical protein [Chitinophagales bacterium]